MYITITDGSKTKPQLYWLQGVAVSYRSSKWCSSSFYELPRCQHRSQHSCQFRIIGSKVVFGSSILGWWCSWIQPWRQACSRLVMFLFATVCWSYCYAGHDWKQNHNLLTLWGLWLVTDHQNGARVASKSCLAASIGPTLPCQIRIINSKVVFNYPYVRRRM